MATPNGFKIVGRRSGMKPENEWRDGVDREKYRQEYDRIFRKPTKGEE